MWLSFRPVSARVFAARELPMVLAQEPVGPEKGQAWAAVLGPAP